MRFQVKSGEMPSIEVSFNRLLNKLDISLLKNSREVVVSSRLYKKMLGDLKSLEIEPFKSEILYYAEALVAQTLHMLMVCDELVYDDTLHMYDMEIK